MSQTTKRKLDRILALMEQKSGKQAISFKPGKLMLEALDKKAKETGRSRARLIRFWIAERLAMEDEDIASFHLEPEDFNG